jgi:DNA modification methylase
MTPAGQARSRGDKGMSPPAPRQAQEGTCCIDTLDTSRFGTRTSLDPTLHAAHERPTIAPEASLPLPPEFLAAVLSTSKVTACPHNLYKYPARFAPEFAREAIRAFSQPGDVVLDVFNGGATGMIEAVALGRRAVGYDISQLACFIAQVKSTPLSVHDERALLEWNDHLPEIDNTQATAAWDSVDTDDGYYRRNLPQDALGFFSVVIARLTDLPKERQRRFARLVLLSVGQWALDCKKHVPTASRMREEFRQQLATNAHAFHAYTRKVAKDLGIPARKMESRRKIIQASSENCGNVGRSTWKKASLIVTSPPYPGVHMLYHRWQILGRRETPAPFMIADCRDGDGISFYNLGHRGEIGLKTYYARLTKIFAAARTRLKDDGLVVQMVAFNQPDWQLPAFLAAMEAAGYTQVMPELPPEMGVDSNLWRAVPGRRWYVVATRKGNAAAKEVVLFHRPTIG